ncbi:transcriptional-regulating factor 1-like isoform X1 [Brienomyrus brachyistius]|uniref:transcriptional-regulating factor 1-like isoform X1 n=1 Tax=Brienomyrus brachyistius TaxID=42636 RepID=UPI0020B1CE0A|nr:transcriptional-regulating factor 1-like isoform X1 [Brienomyrus brachyistius]
MEEQPLCENNRPEDIYFPQHNSMGVCNMNYGAQPMVPAQLSPASPQYFQDQMESPVTPGQDFSSLVEGSKPGGAWPSSNNRKSIPNLWGSLSQGDALEMNENSSNGGYQFSTLASTESPVTPKHAINSLPRLDSFNQVFASQNLRILQGGGGGNKGSRMLVSGPICTPTDSALRQLLSQKPPQLEQSSMQPSGPQHRYLPMGLSASRSYDQTQSKLMHEHEQQQLQYDYQHQQPDEYYIQQGALQQAPVSECGRSLQQFHQQPQQLDYQQGAFYQPQAHLAAQQPMPSPSFLPGYGQNCKISQQQQQFMQASPAHPSQQAQLYFQEEQKPRPLYHQSSPYLQQPQGHIQDEVHPLPSKQYHSDSNCVLPSPSQHTPTHPAHSFLFPRDHSRACQEPTMPLASTISPLPQGHAPQREVPPSIQQPNCKAGGQQLHSPSSSWLQMRLPNYQDDPLSPDHSIPFHGHAACSIVVKPEVLEKNDSSNKLLCSTCKKVFKSLPALNGHMRSHGGFRALPTPKTKEGGVQLPREDEPAHPVVMPVSVPVKLQPPVTKLPVAPRWHSPDKGPSSHTGLSPQAPWLCSERPQIHAASSMLKSESAGEVEGQAARPVKKKNRHRLQPLVIPTSSPTSMTRVTILYQSQLRSPHIMGDSTSYTPPPMLSPVRQGSGLFSNVKTGPGPPGGSLNPVPPRVIICKTNNASGNLILTTLGPGEKPVDIEPRINIGPRFQAVIPDLQEPSQVEKDIHKAGLLWTPWGDLDSPVAQQKVDNLVNMACSSILPGGGANTELALHCLFECRGNFMATVEKLLVLKPVRHKSNPLSDYHYAGSDKWTVAEKKLFNKAFIIHNKDFFLIQKMVKTKTVAQCVEYYYTCKKISSLGKKQKTCPSDLVPESSNDWAEAELDAKKSQEREPKALRSPDLSDPPTNGTVVLSKSTFVCEVPGCGLVFSSKPALSGHGRIHSSPSSCPKPLSDRSKPKTQAQSVSSSLKSSPAHSTTSGETDSTLLFPCKECGKVFFKIKSRNAHMKTHRQQDDVQVWRLQKPVGHMPVEGAPTSPRISQVPMALLQLPIDHMGLVKRLREESDHPEEEGEEEEEEEEEEEKMGKGCPLVARPVTQTQKGTK